MSKLLTTKEEIYLDALEAIWGYCDDKCGMCVTKGYAEAIQKVARALGKKDFVLEEKPSGMFYVGMRDD